MLEQRIQQHFIDSADLRYQAAEALSRPIADAVQALLAGVTSGGKVLACGQGACHALARAFATLFVGPFERERPELAALALPADDSGDSEGVFARQIRALGQAGDVLLLITTGGDHPALLAALACAHEREMSVVALTGRSGGAVARALRETDVHVAVPHERGARILEVHQLVLHCLCDGVDTQLLGELEPTP